MSNILKLDVDRVPEDLSAVQADDRLLDALGSATPGAAGALVDDELNALLLAWRNEVETEPFDEKGLDTEAAIAVIQAAKPKLGLPARAIRRVKWLFASPVRIVLTGMLFGVPGGMALWISFFG